LCGHVHPPGSIIRFDLEILIIEIEKWSVIPTLEGTGAKAGISFLKFIDWVRPVPDPLAAGGI
jgi:hypothetical protein